MDVGTVRVGVAASDPDGRMAFPVITLPRDPAGIPNSAGWTELIRVRRAARFSSVCPPALSGREGTGAEAAGIRAAPCGAGRPGARPPCGRTIDHGDREPPVARAGRQDAGRSCREVGGPGGSRGGSCKRPSMHEQGAQREHSRQHGERAGPPPPRGPNAAPAVAGVAPWACSSSWSCSVGRSWASAHCSGNVTGGNSAPDYSGDGRGQHHRGGRLRARPQQRSRGRSSTRRSSRARRRSRRWRPRMSGCRPIQPGYYQLHQHMSAQPALDLMLDPVARVR